MDIVKLTAFSGKLDTSTLPMYLTKKLNTSEMVICHRLTTKLLMECINTLIKMISVNHR